MVVALAGNVFRDASAGDGFVVHWLAMALGVRWRLVVQGGTW